MIGVCVCIPESLAAGAVCWWPYTIDRGRRDNHGGGE